jgi:hypothetical protein
LYFVMNSDLMNNLSSLDILSVVIAALGHDVGHMALTNRYLVNSRDPLAIQYNDNSVLENMHCAMTYSIMTKPGCDILGSLAPNDWLSVRKTIIEMILETDMSKHFEILAKFKTRAVVLSDLNLNIEQDKSHVLAMGLKCADISHSAKDTDLHVKWSKLVNEEFFAQGDLEKLKHQPVSMYCDRNNTDMPKSQIGFIKNICLPLFEIWCAYLGSEMMNNVPLAQIRKNIAYWESMMRKRKATVMPSQALSPTGDLRRRQSEF